MVEQYLIGMATQGKIPGKITSQTALDGGNKSRSKMNIDLNKVPDVNNDGTSLKVSVTSPTTNFTLESLISGWRPSVENAPFFK